MTSIQDFDFRSLKEKLKRAPVLQYPMCEGKYQIFNDTSNAAIGVLLIHLTSKWYLRVEYKSLKLINGDCCYLIHNKEMLIMSHCLFKCQCYLERQNELMTLNNRNFLI